MRTESPRCRRRDAAPARPGAYLASAIAILSMVGGWEWYQKTTSGCGRSCERFVRARRFSASMKAASFRSFSSLYEREWERQEGGARREAVPARDGGVDPLHRGYGALAHLRRPRLAVFSFFFFSFVFFRIGSHTVKVLPRPSSLTS